jgi:triacylglycerol lipase
VETPIPPFPQPDNPAMNLPDILNVAIGLVLLFFLLSTIASLVIELLTGFVRYREEVLQSTVHRLLLGGPDRPWGLVTLLWDRIAPGGRTSATAPGAGAGQSDDKNWWPRLKAAGVNQTPTLYPAACKLASAVGSSARLLRPNDDFNRYTESERSQELLRQFWNHAKIRSLVSNEAQAPAALSSATFTQVLVDIVVPTNAQGELPDNRLALERALALPDSIAPDELRKTLRTLALTTEIPPGATGENLWKPYRASIAAWFDEASAQATDLYRQKVKGLLVVGGMLLALGLNADALRAVQVLYHDRSLREATAAYAETVAAEKEAGNLTRQASQDLTKTRQELAKHVEDLRALDAIGFPLGWTEVEWLKIWTKREESDVVIALILKVLGIVATGLAVAQGGPFWYDLMQKLVGMRKGSGAQGAENPEEKPAAPRASTPGSKVVPKTPLPLEIGHDLAMPALGFSARKAHWLASAAAAAYSPESDVKVLVKTNWLFPHFDFFDQKGAQAFVAADDKVILIAFRGTEVTDVRDILVDVRFELRRFDFSGQSGAADDERTCRVHEGFLDSFHSLKDKLVAWIDARLAATPGAQIYLTGHSLGGALATVTFAHLSRLKDDRDASAKSADGAAPNGTQPVTGKPRIPAPTLYTFGCPQVGNGRFARHLDQRYPERIFRVENHVDIVPELPEINGYEHVGRRMYFNAEGKMEVNPSSLGRLLAEIRNGAEKDKLKDVVAAKIAAHGVANYVERCERLARSIA